MFDHGFQRKRRAAFSFFFSVAYFYNLRYLARLRRSPKLS
jgi:hypothetical protein